LTFIKEEVNTLLDIYNIKNVETIMAVFNNTNMHLVNHIGYCFTYIELGYELYNLLYTMGNYTLYEGIKSKDQIMKVAKDIIPNNQLKVIWNYLLKVLMGGWLYYIQTLLMNTRSEDIKDIIHVVEKDVEQLLMYFSNKGLSLEEVKDGLKPMYLFVQYITTDDKRLIEKYKTIGSQNEAERELIIRILFGRSSKLVEHFFDLYKDILIE